MVPLLGMEVVQLIANAVFHHLCQPIQEGPFAGLIERLDILKAGQQGILDNIPGLGIEFDEARLQQHLLL